MKNVSIYGMGRLGLQVAFCLNEIENTPVCFIDNAPEKEGASLLGIRCFSVELYKNKYGLDGTIIVAIKNYAPVIEGLISIGFQNVISYKDIIEQRQYRPINNIEECQELLRTIKNSLKRDGLDEYSSNK